MTNQKRCMVVAMSGGVDSSVAAALLVEAGHNVIGVMMELWSDPGCENLCCTPDSMALARGIADQLGIPFYAIDAKNAFRERVVQFFIDSYKSGETPNPCVACNRHLRWHTILKEAEKLGASHIATGHYARLRVDQEGNAQLLRGVDGNKDQSYVLHGLTQDQLSRTLFPLGDYTKPEIREIARKYALSVAERPDSQDLCFVGNEGYRDFLVRHAPEVVDPGPMVTSDGKVVGRHQGLAFYTIGQRKGLRIPAPHPFYVLEKDVSQNRLIIGPAEELGRDELWAGQVNWVSGNPPKDPVRVLVKIRYKANDIWGWVRPQEDDKVHIKFDETLRDITPGQAAVFYDGEICLGGGIIDG